ncbi:MAG: hypothetical protein OXF46_08765 [Rhodobacteraceae bacterium]|nr:hypothetical protein [Paracoccaceae bacterium]
MYNNLNSFHDTIAESKAEREQYDRLLTISTPRERLLILTICILFLGMGTWLFTGNVKHHFSANGMVVDIESPQNGDNTSVALTIWIESDISPQIEAGTPARLHFDSVKENQSTIYGEVALVFNPIPDNDLLTLISDLAGGYLYHVQIVLDETMNLKALMNQECEVVFHIGTVTPLNYFLMG